MQHSSLVVLGLLADRPRHGYDLEKEIRRLSVRMWAKVGTSTIYKCLKDLEKEGSLTSRSEAADRGAGRAVFSITDYGRSRLADLVRGALRSDASVYSDRIVGMAFAKAIDRPAAARSLAGAHGGLAGGLAGLEKVKETTDDPTWQIILDYYIDVISAERTALRRAAALLGHELPAEAAL